MNEKIVIEDSVVKENELEEVTEKVETRRLALKYNGVEVYEPNEEQEAEIIRMVSPFSKIKKKGIVDINIDGKFVLKKIMPMITNLKEEDIDDENPSINVKIAFSEVAKIVRGLSILYKNNSELLSMMSKEELVKLAKGLK